MPDAYTEDQLVEQSAKAEGPPPNSGVVGEPRAVGLLGRETKGEVVLVHRAGEVRGRSPMAVRTVSSLD